jgi:hypothetical protein
MTINPRVEHTAIWQPGAIAQSGATYMAVCERLSFTNTVGTLGTVVGTLGKAASDRRPNRH